MTKLKNTKKGMAKKALSVSLVAAMLATSNVPVWAAEDLFTDGSGDVAVEAPVVEEEPAAEVETFSSEPTEEVNDAVQVQASATSTDYSVEPTINGVTDNKVVWNNTTGVNATFSIEAENGQTIPENVKFFYAWKVNGFAEELESISNYTSFTTKSPELSAEDAEGALTLYIQAIDENNNDNVIWEYTSDAITIEAVDETVEMARNITLNETEGEFTGESIDATNFIKWGNAVSSNYDVTVSGDTTNVTDSGITVTITANRTGYKGSIDLKYTIKPKTLDGTSGKMISEHMEATVTTTSFTYTGNVIRVKASDVTLVDKETGADLSNYLQTDANGYVSIKNTTAQNVGKTTFTLNLINGTPTSGIKNYTIAQSTGDADGYRTIETSNEATVTARDLSTVNIKIKSKSIPQAGQTVVLNEDDITYTDKTTGEELNLNPVLNYSVPSNATQAGTYTVRFTPVANTQNVTGEATAQLRLVVADLSEAVFSGSEATTPEEYTGEAVTKTASQLGSLLLDGAPVDASAYEVTYANNINAGENTAQIIVNGKGSFEGSQAVFYFTINPAKVTEDDITVSNSVEYIDTQNPADYKGKIGLVVKGKNADGKEFTLEEDKDYTVKYSCVDSNDIGESVKADITITNKNYIKDGAKTFTADLVRITPKVLKSENIKLTQTEFTYTGKPIQPEFDIVFDGKIIDPSLFTARYSDNINAGTATLTVEGNEGSDYEGEKASITYTINPAETASLEGVITSQQYTGYSLTLEEDDFNLTLDGDRINIYDNFSLTYGTNVEIGEGTVTLTPKNENFTGSRTFTFQITGKMLSSGGTFTFYENGINITSEKDSRFKYDRTEHEFDQVVFKYDGNEKLSEGTDYDIVYADNVYGKEISGKTGRYGAVLAVAKGEYGSDYDSNGIEKGVYTDAEGNKTANVIAVEYFAIEQQPIVKSNVSVSNGTYAGGLPVSPVVSVVVNGVLLTEGEDYELEFKSSEDRINVTTSKNLHVDIKPINGYSKGADLNTFNWGIDKFNLANADVTADENTVTVKCGRVDVETSEYTVTREGSSVTVAAVEGSKNYTGSKTINIEVEDEKPAAPVISEVNVSGNNATVVLSGESDGATGYDYVISTDRNCITNKDYDKVNKNILSTETTFTYTQQGVYYAYCHAWKRVDGVKVFSDWSEAYPFSVTAITPEQPVITSVKKSGRNLTVTWTQSANATTGYDVVMGTAVRKVNGELRPVEYGKAVKKVGPNTFSVTFRSIPKGTYYVGLHAHNRTSETGVKVFSPWSNYKTVTF